MTTSRASGIDLLSTPRESPALFTPRINVCPHYKYLYPKNWTETVGLISNYNSHGAVNSFKTLHLVVDKTNFFFISDSARKYFNQTTDLSVNYIFHDRSFPNNYWDKFIKRKVSVRSWHSQTCISFDIEEVDGVRIRNFRISRIEVGVHQLVLSTLFHLYMQMYCRFALMLLYKAVDMGGQTGHLSLAHGRGGAQN